jgi:hypothetical protein
VRGLAIGSTVVALASLAAPGYAQERVVRQGDDRLKGIAAVEVTIDPVPPDAARCGLTREQLQKTAVAALKRAGVKATLSEKAGSSPYTVYATVSSVRLAGQCATSVVTELTAQIEGVPEADRSAPAGAPGSLLVGQLTLIRHNGVISSRASAHASSVWSLLREHLTDIATRIAVANK